MNELKKDITVKELQEYVRQMCAERGWNDPYDRKFLIFMEEVGELAKAMRQNKKLYDETAKEGKRFDLEEEFADVLSYICDLANCFDVDLESAFRKKDEVNRKRVWKKKID